jgi:hypothetical protein
MGLVEGALGHGAVTSEQLERLAVVAKGVGHLTVGEVAVAGRVFLSVLKESGEQGGLQALDATQAPGGQDDVGGQEVLLGVGGLEVVEQGVAQVVVLGLVFVVHVEDVPGGEAVLERVAGGAGLAFAGARTSGTEGVAAVRRDLFEGRHKSTYLCNAGVGSWVLGLGIGGSET